MTWIHHAILAGFSMLVGTAVGSFLNVCIHRIPARTSLFWPPSRCPGCRRSIAARDNIPILGWLLLRGECRNCGAAISARYPAVEALTGMLFAAVYVSGAALAPADMGPVAMLACLVPAMLAVSVLVTAAFIAHDARQLTAEAPGSHDEPEAPGAGGEPAWTHSYQPAVCTVRRQLQAAPVVATMERRAAS